MSIGVDLWFHLELFHAISALAGAWREGGLMAADYVALGLWSGRQFGAADYVALGAMKFI